MSCTMSQYCFFSTHLTGVGEAETLSRLRVFARGGGGRCYGRLLLRLAASKSRACDLARLILQR